MPSPPRPSASARSPTDDLLLFEAYARDRRRLEDALEGMRRAICSLTDQVQLCMEGVYATDQRVIRLDEQVQQLAGRVDVALTYLPGAVERQFDEWFDSDSSEIES